jgi:hypothetical protein
MIFAGQAAVPFSPRPHRTFPALGLPPGDSSDLEYLDVLERDGEGLREKLSVSMIGRMGNSSRSR